MSRHEDVCNANEHHQMRLADKANVQAVAAGENSVVVYVNKKLPLSELAEEDVVDPEVDGVPTDVVEIGDLDHMIGFTSDSVEHMHHERVLPGARISLSGVNSWGTLGMFVRNQHGELSLLSNNHVIADYNRADLLTPVQHLTPQGYRDRIAYLEMYMPFLDNRRNNYLDSAIARVESYANVNRSNPNGDMSRDTTTATIGTNVRMRGARSGNVSGTVTGINATVNVGSYRYVRQTVTSRMLNSGDSGSVGKVSRNDGSGEFDAALLGFAGSSSASIWTPIDRVMRRYGIEPA